VGKRPRCATQSSIADELSPSRTTRRYRERVEVFCSAGMVGLYIMKRYFREESRHTEMLQHCDGNSVRVATLVDRWKTRSDSPTNFVGLIAVHERTIEAAELLS
jgi:hypothetical protein